MITTQELQDDMDLMIEEKNLGGHKQMTAAQGIFAMERRIKILQEDARVINRLADDEPVKAGLILGGINLMIAQAKTRLEWYTMQVNGRN